MINVLAVAFGGATGSVLRYGIQKWLNVAFPFGTLTVNILGCFIAGYLSSRAINGLNETAFLFAMTGFCGGFTTFSALSVENLQLIRSGNWLLASGYSLFSLIGGALATYFGYKIFSA